MLNRYLIENNNNERITVSGNVSVPNIVALMLSNGQATQITITQLTGIDEVSPIQAEHFG